VSFLRIEGLHRRFGERVALDGLTVEVARGETFGVLGPNGAGKSTAFQILAGMLAADGGRILLDGAPVDPARDPQLRARLGVVFQQPSLDGKLTGRENLQLGASLYCVPRAIARRRIDDALDLFELADRADEPAERYSGGMRRRLELARVLLHEPELLVMDEPSSGLDQASLRRFWAQLGELRKRRSLTILVTTHQPEEAEQCDRLAVIDRGRVIAEGTPEELRARVGGDVITVEAEAPDEIARAIAETFALAPRVVDGRILVEAPRAHELIPRLVERFPSGRLRAVGMRPPSLADVFVKLTGRALAQEAN